MSTSTDSIDYDASYFNNTTLDTTAGGPCGYYRREGVNKVNATLEDALSIGTLKEDETQLDVTAQVNRANSENYYAFTLEGDSLKIDLHNVTDTSTLRVQILDSNGDVVADSSSYADDSLLDAFNEANSSDGLDLDAGEYYVKVSYDLCQLKAIGQTYKLCLYSGTHFSNSYETEAVSQTRASQHVSIDDTMTFSALDALQYSNDDVHRADASIDSTISIGWLYENKTALGVYSELTNVCDEQYYSLTLQKGENLKLAMDNKTDTAEIRVQVMDPTGLRIYADSHGTEEQQAAYQELISSGGLEANKGDYVIKISFAPGESKSASQVYKFSVYSGDIYTSYYETTVATENADTALLSGSYGSTSYTPLSYLSTYLMAESNGEESSIMDVLAEI